MDLPEHEKLKDIQPNSQSIGEFIEWLGEQGIWLCKLGKFDRFQPINDDMNKLLPRYFEIDLRALEAEKLLILDAQRALNERAADEDRQ